MQNDKNIFGNHPVNEAYKKFTSDLDMEVAKGKIHQLDAITHVNNLHKYAQENNHEEAEKYIKEHSKKLGLHQPTWQKEEKWGK